MNQAEVELNFFNDLNKKIDFNKNISLIFSADTTGLKDPKIVTAAYNINYVNKNTNKPETVSNFTLFNPNKAIEIGASKIHGFSDEDIKKLIKTENIPKFEESELFNFLRENFNKSNFYLYIFDSYFRNLLDKELNLNAIFFNEKNMDYFFHNNNTILVNEIYKRLAPSDEVNKTWTLNNLNKVFIYDTVAINFRKELSELKEKGVTFDKEYNAIFNVNLTKKELETCDNIKAMYDNYDEYLEKKMGLNINEAKLMKLESLINLLRFPSTTIHKRMMLHYNEVDGETSASLGKMLVSDAFRLTPYRTFTHGKYAGRLLDNIPSEYFYNTMSVFSTFDNQNSTPNDFATLKQGLVETVLHEPYSIENFITAFRIMTDELKENNAFFLDKSNESESIKYIRKAIENNPKYKELYEAPLTLDKVLNDTVSMGENFNF